MDATCNMWVVLAMQTDQLLASRCLSTRRVKSTHNHLLERFHSSPILRCSLPVLYSSTNELTCCIGLVQQGKVGPLKPIVRMANEGVPNVIICKAVLLSLLFGDKVNPARGATEQRGPYTPNKAP